MDNGRQENRYKKCLVHKNATIYDAVEKMNESGLQLAIVVDEYEHIIGIINDGDIRRAVLKKVDFYESILKITNTTPRVATSKQSDSELRMMMRDYNIHQIPIVNECGVVCGIKTFQELICSSTKDNAVVLMAGGEGRRLRPMTESCPKPLLKVGGKPILATIIDNFIDAGFHRFFISVNYKSEMIEDYFGDGSDRGITIDYLREKEKMGTAGSLQLLPKDEELPIIVMNGDILTNINIEALLNFHECENACATMTSRTYSYQVPYGVLQCDGNEIRRITEKPRNTYFVSAGIYVLNPSVISIIEKKHLMDMPDVFENLIQENKRVLSYPLTEYWMDIGQMDDFEKAQSDYEEVFAGN